MPYANTGTGIRRLFRPGMLLIYCGLLVCLISATSLILVQFPKPARLLRQYTRITLGAAKQVAGTSQDLIIKDTIKWTGTEGVTGQIKLEIIGPAIVKTCDFENITTSFNALLITGKPQEILVRMGIITANLPTKNIYAYDQLIQLDTRTISESSIIEATPQNLTKYLPNHDNQITDWQITVLITSPTDGYAHAMQTFVCRSE